MNRWIIKLLKVNMLNNIPWCQIWYTFSEPFTRTAHRLDGPGPFTRQLIKHMGRAHLLDELSSKRERRRVGPAHLLDSSSSKWDRARSLDKEIKAIIVRAILIFLAPRYLKKASRLLEICEVCWRYL